tara:strand:+ start:272 stop:463 length:192 start_codon:yes stop_codon:yes gene_type:complete
MKILFIFADGLARNINKIKSMLNPFCKFFDVFKRLSFAIIAKSNMYSIKAKAGNDMAGLKIRI